jgi:hypothetical protein
MPGCPIMLPLGPVTALATEAGEEDVCAQLTALSSSKSDSTSNVSRMVTPICCISNSSQSEQNSFYMHTCQIAAKDRNNRNDFTRLL